MAERHLQIDVVLALPEVQQVHRLRLSPGVTAEQAIVAAGCVSSWQDGQGGYRPLACFGRLIAPDTVLADGDRVEILRPLLADPKAQRRARVQARKKASARGGGQGVLEG